MLGRIQTKGNGFLPAKPANHATEAAPIAQGATRLKHQCIAHEASNSQIPDLKAKDEKAATFFKVSTFPTRGADRQCHVSDSETPPKPLGQLHQMSMSPTSQTAQTHTRTRAAVGGQRHARSPVHRPKKKTKHQALSLMLQHKHATMITRPPA